MFSLFSSFDYFWFSFPFLDLTFFLLMYASFSSLKNFLFHSFFLLKNFLLKFFSSLNSDGFSKSSIFIFFMIMIFVLFLNLFSVFPYNFAHSSQISIVLFLGLGLWVTSLVYMLSQNFVYTISHLVPEGSPFFLIPILFLIELISNLIRPITLTVRLVANILAGHLLMILLSKVVLSFSFSLFLFFLLNSVEIMVSLIQSYIFATMITLYHSEVS